MYFYTQKSSLCLQTAFLKVHFVSLDNFCSLEEMAKFRIAHGYIWLMQNKGINRDCGLICRTGGVNLKAILSSSKDIFWYKRYLFSPTWDDYWFSHGAVYFSLFGFLFQGLGQWCGEIPSRKKQYNPVLGPSPFSCVCEIHKNTKNGSVSVRMSVHLL